MPPPSILVADDNLAVRIMLEDILTEAGYAVTTTQDGQDTMTCLDDTSFDLVILDLLMPKLSGFEIMERLRDRKTMPPILVLTGIFKSATEIERVRRLGAKGYIYKSAPVEEILFRVNRALFSPKASDSRGAPRIPVSLPVEFCVEGKWLSAYTGTLSTKGLFIRTVDPLPAGTSLSLKFSVINSTLPLEIEAQVVWCNEYNPHEKKTSLPGMGVVFASVEREHLEALEVFIADRMEKDLTWK